MGEFKFVQKDTLKRDFKITAPDDSELSIEGMEFKYMTSEEWHKLSQEKGNASIFDIVLGWDKFAAADGAELEYSEEALEMFLGQHFVLVRIFDMFVGAITGADRKNFSASLALGLAAKARAAQNPRKTKKKQKKS